MQHLNEMLDINMAALDWMMKCYPEIKEREDMRKLLGRYGLSGAQQVGHSFDPPHPASQEGRSFFSTCV